MASFSGSTWLCVRLPVTGVNDAGQTFDQYRVNVYTKTN